MRRNKFPASCSVCRGAVPAGGGYLLGKDDDSGRWRTVCDACFARATAEAEAEVEAGFAFAAAVRARRSWSRPVHAHVPPCLKVLGLRPPADPAAIKRRFRELAKASHPDTGGDAARFMAIEGAYRQALALAGGRP